MAYEKKKKIFSFFFGTFVFFNAKQYEKCKTISRIGRLIIIINIMIAFCGYYFCRLKKRRARARVSKTTVRIDRQPE